MLLYPSSSMTVLKMQVNGIGTLEMEIIQHTRIQNILSLLQETYTVNLTVSNENGSNSKAVNITVLEQSESLVPAANFSTNITTGYAPLSVQFNDSSENASEWKWDFGDGNNSTDQNPEHTFFTPGNYTVNLTVKNENGSSSKVTEITVLEQSNPVAPVANFSTNVTTGYAPLSVQFNDSSENASEWNWDFGDGNSSTYQNPEHTFFTPGNYTVNLTVSNENGSNSKAVNITVLEQSESLVLAANFSTNITTGYAPLSVQFNDSSENASEWKWDFGDGNSSTDQNPEHTFFIPGNYTVNLTVTNENGSSSKFVEITVLEQSNPVVPVANFSTNVTTGYAPLSVQFNDSSENGSEWNWDFGDGNSSTDQNPEHTFFTSGNYTVNLTVTNENGSNSKAVNITVLEQSEPLVPAANFSSNVTTGYAPLSVKFNDSSENASEWSWDFGDGNSSTYQNPEHTFLTSGNYTVNLTVTNENGSNSKFVNITVLEKLEPVNPVANFSTNVTTGYAPLSIQFNDSSENGSEWNWDFGDGNSSTDPNPEHTFFTPGNYTVNLTVSNENGSNSKSVNITVLEQSESLVPAANFSSNVTTGYAPLSVKFNDSSENASEWSWDFGDGNSSTYQNPEHTFLTSGNYTVNLTVTNENGSSSKVTEITVLEKLEPLVPAANFSTNITTGYAPLYVQFNDSSENGNEWNWDFGDENSSTEQNPEHTFFTSRKLPCQSDSNERKRFQFKIC